MDNQNNNFINTNATETNSSNGFKSSKPSKASKPQKEKKQGSGAGFGKAVVLTFCKWNYRCNFSTWSMF